ncbi:hypothetical protein CsSME_00020771 [Camellia sinensis var. sinensis]
MLMNLQRSYVFLIPSSFNYLRMILLIGTSYYPLSNWNTSIWVLQSALADESFPVTKSPRDGVYSGSTCKQGEIEAVVIATGVHTFFGKAAHLVDSTNQVGHFQKVFRR